MENPEAPKSRVSDLLAIMAALRAPGTGCPWDLEQSFETIAPYTIEEAYEVADAIERKDMDALKDELGDLLLQVVYHAQMASESGAFGFDDVVDGICRKMVRRHPHVFGDMEVGSEAELKGLWERIKAQEKAEQRGSPDDGGVLADVPVALPALTRAVKLQKRAGRVGFDWPDTRPVLDKIREEVSELETAAAGSEPSRDRIAEEFGDLLFVLANLARHLRLDPEDSLRAANAKFVRRFRRIEEQLADEGRTPEESDLEEMDRLWDRAKAEEKDTRD